MRTILITGTDNEGYQPWHDFPWVEKPLIQLDRTIPASVRNMWHEMANIGKADAVAIGMRGRHDQGYRHMALWNQIYKEMRPSINLLPWMDTGALRDIASWGVEPQDFDFDNADHVERFWQDGLLPFFEAFPDGPYERTPDGRILVPFWSVNEPLARNKHLAGRLLDRCTRGMQEIDLGEPAYIVDQSWPADVKVHGRHSWFDPVRSAFTITRHKEVIVGVVVPGFHDPVGSDMNRTLLRGNGEVFRRSLYALAAWHADYILIESYSNGVESAGLYRSPAWTPDTLYLDILRKFILEHSPVELVPSVVTDTEADMAEYVISRSESVEHPTKPDLYYTWYPRGQRETILCIELANPNSKTGDADYGTFKRTTRLLNAPSAPAGIPFDPKVHGLGGVPGAWESWRDEDTRSVFPEAPGEFCAIPLVD